MLLYERSSIGTLGLACRSAVAPGWERETTYILSRTPSARAQIGGLRLTDGSVRAQRWPQQRHIVFLEERGDDRSIRIRASRNRSQLLIELVSTTWCIDHDDLALLIRQVQESMWDLGREIGEAPFLAEEDLVPDLDLVPTLQDVDGLFLLVVDV